jgi:small multidrug resistance pump
MSEGTWRFLQDRIRPGLHIHLLILSILIQAFGAVCTKYAADSTSTQMVFGIPYEMIFYFFILCGMGLQVLVWQYALKYYSLSFAYPFRSLVNFVVLFFAYLLFNESITIANFVGLSIITIGVMVLARDKEILL